MSSYVCPHNPLHITFFVLFHFDLQYCIRLSLPLTINFVVLVISGKFLHGGIQRGNIGPWSDGESWLS